MLVLSLHNDNYINLKYTDGTIVRIFSPDSQTLKAAGIRIVFDAPKEIEIWRSNKQEGKRG